MAKLSTIQEYEDWKAKQEFNAQRNAPRAVAPGEKPITDIGKKFAADNQNISPERQMAIDEGQRSLTPPSANDPYAAARAARWEGQGSAPPQKSSAPPIPQSESGAATGAQNSLDKMAEVRNSNNIGDLARLARGASAVANTGKTLVSPNSGVPSRPLPGIDNSDEPVPSSYRSPPPVMAVSEEQARKRLGNPFVKGDNEQIPPPSQAAIRAADAVRDNEDSLYFRNAPKPQFLQASPTEQGSASTTRSPAKSNETQLTPYEHDMRALDIIRGDREKRIAQRALVPQQASVDTDRLSKIGSIMRFEMDSALRNTPGRSQAKAAAAQAIAESYKPEIEAITNKGKEANALEKQRITNAADLQSKGNASDARIAAQESRNQMLEKLSKDRLDTQLALANRPRYTPAREEYTDDYGDKVTDIVPFNTATGTIDRSATGGLPAKQYEAVKEAQRISAMVKANKPLSKSEQAHWDKWGPTEEIWGKVR